jgi:Ca2+-binding RTX toxin-like protein
VKRSAIALAATLLVLAAPAAAEAAIVVSYSAEDGLLVDSRLARGESPHEGIEVVGSLPWDIRSPLHVKATNSATILSAGVGCQLLGTEVVRCAVPGSHAVTAALRGGDDSLVVAREYYIGRVRAEGGDGNDHLVGARAPDRLDGGRGNDEIEGEGGPDTLIGGEHDDVFIGDVSELPSDRVTGPQTDTITGGEGNDELRARGLPDVNEYETFVRATSDLFDGGPGTDVANYSARPRGVRMTVTAAGDGQGTDDGEINENDDLDGVETLIGGSGWDTILLTGLTFSLEPPRGFTLQGGPGQDTIDVTRYVFATLEGGPDPDVLSGGSWADRILARDGARDTIDCDAGPDFVHADAADAWDQGIPANCEEIDFY